MIFPNCKFRVFTSHERIDWQGSSISHFTLGIRITFERSMNCFAKKNRFWRQFEHTSIGVYNFKGAVNKRAPPTPSHIAINHFNGIKASQSYLSIDLVCEKLLNHHIITRVRSIRSVQLFWREQNHQHHLCKTKEYKRFTFDVVWNNKTRP